MVTREDTKQTNKAKITTTKIQDKPYQVKCLSHKQAGLSSVSDGHIGNQAQCSMLVIPELGRQVEPWGSLDRRSGLIFNFWVAVRHPVSKHKVTVS